MNKIQCITLKLVLVIYVTMEYVKRNPYSYLLILSANHPINQTEFITYHDSF